MKIKNSFVMFLVLVAMLSCEKDNVLKTGSLDGTYEGIFFRTSSWAKYEASNVTLTFDGNRFEGSGSIAKYPAICRGTYKLNGDEIEFVNLCPWTAESDWSYILSGKFVITKNGDEIVMTKNYRDFVDDTYKLKQTSR